MKSSPELQLLVGMIVATFVPIALLIYASWPTSVLFVGVFGLALFVGFIGFMIPFVIEKLSKG